MLELEETDGVSPDDDGTPSEPTAPQRDEKGRVAAAKPAGEEGGESEEGEEPEGEGEEKPDAEGEEEPAAASEGEETDAIHTLGDLAKAFEVDEAALAEHLMVPVGEEQVPLSDVINAYTSQPDVALGRAELEQERQAFYDQRNEFQTKENDGLAKLAGVTDRMLKVLEGTKRTEVEWAQLKEEDPIQYAIEREEYREKQELVAQGLQSLREADTQRTQQEKADFEQYAQAETKKVFQARPEWWDTMTNSPSQAGVEAANLVDSYLKELGYTAQEIDMIVDSRQVLAMYDAARGRQLSKKVELSAKKVRKAPGKVITPRGKTDEADGKRERSDSLRRNLAKTGTVEDAAAVFLHEGIV
jgi:hypothetical protein